MIILFSLANPFQYFLMESIKEIQQFFNKVLRFREVGLRIDTQNTFFLLFIFFFNFYLFKKNNLI